MLDQKERMHTETVRKRFSVGEFMRMVDAGIFGRKERVELLEGEILKMSPIGSPHAAAVDRANALLSPLHGRAIVRIQGPIRLGNYSQPQPDLILLKPRKDYYAVGGAVAGDALLVIEVADTSLLYDRGPKLKAYAKHGVREVWIEDLTTTTLLVFRDITSGRFATELTLKPGDSISPEAFPDFLLPVSGLLGAELG